MRLDRALCARFGLSRSLARHLVAHGAVTESGRPVPKGLSLRAGMVLDVDLGAAELRARPDPGFRLTVMLEDPWFVAIDKPGGIPSHPLQPGELGCAANMLVARYPELASVGFGPREPGLLHRLDTGTSGLLLAARTPESFAELRGQMERGEIRKTYLALTAQAVSVPQRVERALAPGRGGRVEISSAPHGQPRITEVVGCTPRGRFFLVEAHAAHAYRHQIRVHLAALGAPLVGDAMYGGEPLPGVSHHLLHAASIHFRHPHSGHPVSVEAPLPADWPT